MRHRLTNHRLGKHRGQHERVAVQDAKVEFHPWGADLECVAVDDLVRAVVDLAAFPVQRAELAGSETEIDYAGVLR